MSHYSPLRSVGISFGTAPMHHIIDLIRKTDMSPSQTKNPLITSQIQLLIPTFPATRLH